MNTTVFSNQSVHVHTPAYRSARHRHHPSLAERCGAWTMVLALCASLPWAYAGGRTTANLKGAKQKEIKTEELHVTVGPASVYCLAAGPVDGHPILLMHGARFGAHTWLGTNTIQDLAGAGYRVFSMDIPGFGNSPRATIYSQTFVTELLSKLTKKPAILVTPSLSGRFAFPPLLESSHEIAGWVAVAPATIDQNIKKLDKIKVPTLVMWGEKDQVFPLSLSDVLVANIPDSRKVILKGAQHPCYLDQPEQFNRAVLDFAASVFRKKKENKK